MSGGDGSVWLHADGRVTVDNQGTEPVAATYRLDFCREKQLPASRHERCEALLTYADGSHRRCEVRTLNLTYGEHGRERCKPQRLGFGARGRWGLLGSGVAS